jgi:SNF2 family DNA or RNA helicase
MMLLLRNPSLKTQKRILTFAQLSSLDLTAACRVHLMEPQWNPMAEEQALDRVHRLGQSYPVVAHRYIVKNSIEEVRIAIQNSLSIIRT